MDADTGSVDADSDVDLIKILDNIVNISRLIATNDSDEFNVTSCQALYLLYEQPWIWLAFSLQTIICPAAIVFNILVIVLLIKSDLVTTNLKLVLINLGVWCTVASLYLFARIVVFFTLHVLNWNCAIQLSRWHCRAQELVFLFCLMQVVLSVFVIAVERLVALCRFTNDVDKMLKDSLVGQILVGFIWSISVVGCIIAVLSLDPEENEPLVFCNMILSAELWRMRILMMVGLAVEIVFVLLYSIAYCATSAKSKSHVKHVNDSDEPYSLSKRFAQKRNVEVHAMLFPTILNQFTFCSSICGGSVLLLFLGLSLPIQNQLLILEYIVHVLFALMAALHPFILLWNSYALRREAERCCSCLFYGLFPPCPSSDAGISPQELKTSQPHSGGSKAEAHFDILNTMWSAEPRTSESKNPLLEGSSNSPTHASNDPRLTSLDVSAFQTIDEAAENEDPYSSIKKSSYKTHYTFSSNETDTKNGAPQPPPHLVHPVIYEDPHEEHIQPSHLVLDDTLLESTPLVLDGEGVHEGTLPRTYIQTTAYPPDTGIYDKSASYSYESNNPAGLGTYDKNLSYSYESTSSKDPILSHSSYKPIVTKDPIMSFSYSASSSSAAKGDNVESKYKTYSHLDNEESEYIKAIRNKYRMPQYTGQEPREEQASEMRDKIQENRANFFSERKPN